MRLPPLDSPQWNSTLRAFAWGMSAISATILSPVLFVTYIGIGARRGRWPVFPLRCAMARWSQALPPLC
jgi:hypothetical protein